MIDTVPDPPRSEGSIQNDATIECRVGLPDDPAPPIIVPGPVTACIRRTQDQTVQLVAVAVIHRAVQGRVMVLRHARGAVEVDEAVRRAVAVREVGRVGDVARRPAPADDDEVAAVVQGEEGVWGVGAEVAELRGAALDACVFVRRRGACGTDVEAIKVGGCGGRFGDRAGRGEGGACGDSGFDLCETVVLGSKSM